MSHRAIDELRAQVDALEAKNKRLSWLLALNPCGHPVAATGGVPDFENDDPTMPQTLYCRWCADISIARQEGRMEGIKWVVRKLMEPDGAIE